MKTITRSRSTNACRRAASDQPVKRFMDLDANHWLLRGYRFGKRRKPELIKHLGKKCCHEQYIADVIKVWKQEYPAGILSSIFEYPPPPAR